MNIREILDWIVITVLALAGMLATQMVFGEVVTCADDALYGQPPAQPGSPGAMPYSEIGEYLALERFEGVSQPIGALTWWGFGRRSDAEACTWETPSFLISFRQDIDGDPGPILHTREVVARMEDTSLTAFGRAIVRFDAVLSEEVDLGQGWITIAGNTGGACFFAWYYSADGDGSYTGTFNGTVFSHTPNDLAFCLGPAPPARRHSADQDGDYTISLAELLRVVQLYNSLAYRCAEATEDGFEPGAGTADQCAAHDADRNDDFRIELQELLRVVQLYNSFGYFDCASQGTEDGFCPGTV